MAAVVFSNFKRETVLLKRSHFKTGTQKCTQNRFALKGLYSVVNCFPTLGSQNCEFYGRVLNLGCGLISAKNTVAGPANDSRISFSFPGMKTSLYGWLRFGDEKLTANN